MKRPKPKTYILTVRLSVEDHRLVRRIQRHDERQSDTVRRAIYKLAYDALPNAHWNHTEVEK